MSRSTQPRPFRRRAAGALAGLLSSALVLSGCSVYDAPLPGGADTGEDPIAVKVMFRDVLDLVPQSTVKLDDVTVGKVKSVELKGYVAEVGLELRKDLDLPDNTRAEIRQTSLLGEKFVSLDAPEEPGSGKLSNSDVIGLDRTGRNPEVEEVLGALSLLLNGGGVGQLKTIFSELNNAFEGREDEIRSVLTQIRSFMGQLDQNKESIVAALENTNRLALQLKREDRTLKSALDNIPDTLRSVNRQRADLVKMLEALERLSGVGVRVIRASKESTINSLRDLAPVLNGFAKAGDAFPKAFQVYLTYPFVDEAVGRDPQVARNLHMGDYTNLSVNLDLEIGLLGDILAPVCDELALVRRQFNARAKEAAKRVVDEYEKDEGSNLPPELRRAIQEGGDDYDGLVDKITEEYLKQAEEQCRAPSLRALQRFGAGQLDDVIDGLPDPLQNQLEELLGGVTGGVTGGGGGGGAPTVPNVPLNPRAQLGSGYQSAEPIDPFDLAAFGRDPGIGTMLLQGVADVR